MRMKKERERKREKKKKEWKQQETEAAQSSNAGHSSQEGTDRWLLLTVHVDLLGEFYELHFSRHVAHGSHAVPQVPAVNKPILVFIKLLKGFS